MNTYLTSFELYLGVEKNSSANTVEAYLTDLKQFAGYVNMDLTKVTINHIRSYMKHLTDLGRARTTITRAVSSIKEFYRYMESEFGIVSPAATLKSYVRTEKLPKYLSLKDIQSILTTAAESRLKTKIICQLLYGTGIRVSELTNLKVEDIDLEEGFLNILGKGSKERLVPVLPGVLEDLEQYLVKNDITSGYVFLKRGSKTEPMSRISVANLVTDVARRAGVDAQVSPHTMRHSYATHLVENGCDMATVQELLGHADIATTKIYAKVTKDAKKKALASFHPLSQ